MAVTNPFYRLQKRMMGKDNPNAEQNPLAFSNTDRGIKAKKQGAAKKKRAEFWRKYAETHKGTA